MSEQNQKLSEQTLDELSEVFASTMTQEEKDSIGMQALEACGGILRMAMFTIGAKQEICGKMVFPDGKRFQLDFKPIQEETEVKGAGE